MMPRERDLIRLAAKFPGLDLSRLGPGKTDHTTRTCTQCGTVQDIPLNTSAISCIHCRATITVRR